MARKKQDLSIVGGSGLGPIGFLQEDFLPELNGQAGVRSYREMLDNDPVIGGMVYAISMFLRRVEWIVEPNEHNKEDPKAEEAAQFVRECLFEDMSHTWSDFLSEVVSFIGYGHAVFEIVYKLRRGPDEIDPRYRSKFTDGRIGIRKLAHRPQSTIWEWKLQDDGGIRAVVQQLPYSVEHKGSAIEIPIQKMLLFRTTASKSNPEGRSVLRNSYVTYKRKQTIEIAEGRAAMRAAGIVEIRIPGDYMAADASDDEKVTYEAYKTMAANLANDRQGGIVMPSDRDDEGNPYFEMTYKSTEGRRPSDMTAIIERYDKRMASSVAADFILLGQDAVGSYALSSDKTTMWVQCLAAYLLMIRDVIQRILLPRLWSYNDFDTDLLPNLKPGTLDERTLTELSDFVSKMGAAGMPLFPDEVLETHLRKKGGLPEASAELRDRADAQADAGLASAEAGAAAMAQTVDTGAEVPEEEEE